jgi:aspartyl/glutamyl-tRNA(Asn/Gln) amidotransferase C subunit
MEKEGKDAIIDINHVMKLAKLDLSGEDLERFGSELNKILEYINMIQSADASKISGILDEFEYDKLIFGADLSNKFYEGCRTDEYKKDESFDFGIVKADAPSFEATDAGSENGFFIVPQIIE